MSCSSCRSPRRGATGTATSNCPSRAAGMRSRGRTDVPRLRVAIALLVPEPAATEIDGLRRALGDRGLANVVPHITLIPPVNVAVDRVPDVLADVRAVAATTPPITLQLGPPQTF